MTGTFNGNLISTTNTQIEPTPFEREAETVQGNLEPGHQNDLVDRVGEIHEDQATPLIKLQSTLKKAKSKK